jgi:serine/threonine protein kinase
MAPELIAGKPYNEKVDVYSYAILMWELFAETLPFSDLPNPW